MTEETKTEVKLDEVTERMNTFVKEYGELVAKHKIDFATYPMFTPDGNGGFKVIIQNTPVDISNQPVKSPLIVNENGAEK